MEQLQKLHPKAVWIFFFRFIVMELWLLFFLAIVTIPYTIRFFIGTPLVERRPLPPGLWIVIIVILVFDYFWARLSYYFYRYQLTDNAVKIEKGVIWKRYVSIPYERVQNVDIYRGLWARILGLSDIHIQTAGLSTGGRGHFAEGRLPGLSIKVAEDLREELVNRVQGKKQGL